MEYYRLLVFHTEKLYDDHVWERLERVVRWMKGKGRKATFFIDPFRAQVIGKDISDRVQTLYAGGGEIGQHTHFVYEGADKWATIEAIDGAEMCQYVRRDYTILQQMGYRPRGFTAGDWFMKGAVLPALAELGFLYDCSARFPKPQGTMPMPHRSWLRSPLVYTNSQGSLLRLPSTCSLTEWFSWGRKVKIDSAVPYQLIYLHDYDLLSPRRYLLLWCFLHLVGRNSPSSLATVVAQHLALMRGNDDA